MAFVLDASITACWAFQDEDHPDADLAFHRIRTEEAAAPCGWREASGSLYMTPPIWN